jgi:hypothetical protein
MKRKLLPIAAVLLGTILSGCAVNGAYVARYGPPPPPPRYGVIGVAPGPGFVWIDGFWDWRGGRWYWVGGRWVRPPRPRAVWVPGYWVETHRGRVFRRGYWRY